MTSSPFVKRAAILVVMLNCGSAQAASLSDALAQTYESNPEIRSQRAALKSTAELIPQALANWFRPTVSGTVTQTNSLTDEKITKSGTTKSTTDLDDSLRDVTAGLSLSMELYSGDTTSADIRYARASYSVSRATLEKTEQTVLAKAATRYLAVVQAQKLLDQSEAHLSELRIVHTRTKELLGHQLATVADLAEVALEIASTEALYETRHTNLQSARSAYMETVGVAPEVVSQWPTLPEMDMDLEKLMGMAERQHPTILAAEFEIDAKRAQLDSNKGELLPTVTLYGSATRERTIEGLEGGTSDYTQRTHLTDYSVALELSVPLYEGGYRSSTIRAARRNISESQMDLDTARRSVDEDLRSAWHSYYGAVSSRNKVEERLRNANIVLEGRQRQYERRQTTVDKVVDAHTAVHSANEALIEQDYNRLVALIDLRVATGSFGVSSLDLGVTPDTVDAYVRDVEENSYIPWDAFVPN